MLCVFSLQSFDGGLAGEEGAESHGGYTYCGFAALAILGKHRAVNLDRLSVRTKGGWKMCELGRFCEVAAISVARTDTVEGNV